MESKELIEQVEDILEAAFVQEDNFTVTANAILSTILAALQEPTEEMIDAYFDRCRNLGIFTHINANAAWRAMINASPLGEQGE
ncbi:hypothetical protein [Brucella rhizosphaerae]|uniref:Uncharacterized protein n=1 Tax=Brucella rhizosphaerae TaxID=571254 RepID=A0A256FL49_9HYPH|nr:hypothetical protein [Brucella rhizosphaerae]OYR15480.1 hypothetical protein CEV32_4755 [Brucella rhizosphaerae]